MGVMSQVYGSPDPCRVIASKRCNVGSLVLLALTPLLVCPRLELVFPPPALPCSQSLLPIDFHLVRLFESAEAHAAAEMALCEAILVPVGGDNGRVGPLDAVLAVVTRRLAGGWRIFSLGGTG
jgi:hypothetical protein